jgi:hypothetical protein
MTWIVGTLKHAEYHLLIHVWNIYPHLGHFGVNISMQRPLVNNSDISKLVYSGLTGFQNWSTGLCKEKTIYRKTSFYRPKKKGCSRCSFKTMMEHEWTWWLTINNILKLVGGWPTPLKNMSSSVGMIKFPTEWKNKMHVPKHQPEKGGLL